MAGEVMAFDPLEDGWYWIRLYPGSNWQIARYESLAFWITGAVEEVDPAEVGRMVEPPEN
jgi:hypothetical protein